MPTPTLREAFAHAELDARPTDIERLQAQMLLRDVSAHLVTEGRVADTVIQGSFARGTSCRPLTDVDLVAVLDQSMERLADEPGGATEAIEGVYSALAELPRSYELSQSPRSIRLRLRGGPAVDISVGIPARNGSLGDDILIADLREDAWRMANPQELARVVSERDERLQQNFTRQVRLVKAAISNLRQNACSRLPGFIVESLAFSAVMEVCSDEEAVARTLRSGAERLGGEIMDPTGRHDVSEKMGPLGAREWKSILGRSSDGLLSRDAEDRWRGIFGPGFI